MSSMRLARAVGLAAGYIGFALVQPSAGAQVSGEVRLQSRQISTAEIVGQLGAKLSPGQPDELPVGVSITGILVDTARLNALGAAGRQPGARVTVIRIALDRVRVEVDELDPVPFTKRLTLRLDGQGRLSVIPRDQRP